MNVQLLAFTQLADEKDSDFGLVDDGKLVSFVAIRTCYSPNKPTKIIDFEANKYFGNEEKEADRLINMIYKSKHTSTLEHVNFTFCIEGVSRALLAQLTRHRHMSFSVQSQRYVKFGTGDKSGGFDYVTPRTVDSTVDGTDIYSSMLEEIQNAYDKLRELGVPAEDARMILPNAATTNLVMTCNLRTLIEFYHKRKSGHGAQWEITELAERLKDRVVEKQQWTRSFFEG